MSLIIRYFLQHSVMFGSTAHVALAGHMTIFGALLEILKEPFDPAFNFLLKCYTKDSIVIGWPTH